MVSAVDEIDTPERPQCERSQASRAKRTTSSTPVSDGARSWANRNQLDRSLLPSGRLSLRRRRIIQCRHHGTSRRASHSVSAGNTARSTVPERGDGGLCRPQQCRLAISIGVTLEFVVRYGFPRGSLWWAARYEEIPLGVMPGVGHRRQTSSLSDLLLRSAKVGIALRRLCRVAARRSVG